MVLDLIDGDGLRSRLFVKLNSGVGSSVLKTEFESLNMINELLPSLYPQALLFDDSRDEAALIMQFHDLDVLKHSDAADAGRALAEQHQMTYPQFGWAKNNYIGTTPQVNEWDTNWVAFFAEQRLRPMLVLSKRQGLSGLMASKVGEVISNLGGLLDHSVVPSFLHGDLWSGNLGVDRAVSKPIFYDPAPYYGDREADLAMTYLFGRQSCEFYQAYEATWPLEAGHENRRAVYNLYHALNHLVLFG